MTQYAIQLQQVQLQFRRYNKPSDVLWEWLFRRVRHRDFDALHAITFELERGCSLGIIGDNGAGKSTLLRLLAGNLQPSSGQCVVSGRKAALLELGTGLHPEASGRDNVRMGLALRGLTPTEIDRYLPQVEAFAELGDFIHQPIKLYSSGMVVRLGFALATVVEPDVLIVDEALSVGDQYFQKKSLDRMQALLKRGATLVFCSHQLYQIRELCQQAIWLEHGQIRLSGDAQRVVDAYQDAVRAKQTVLPAVAATEFLGGIAEPATTNTQPYLTRVQLQSPPLSSQLATELPMFATHAPFAVEVACACMGRALTDIHVGIVIRRNDDIQCYGISTLHDGVSLKALPNEQASVRFVIEQLPLLSGEYCLEVWLIDNTGIHVYDARERCCPFRVQQANQAQGIGLSWMAHRWETEKT